MHASGFRRLAATVAAAAALLALPAMAFAQSGPPDFTAYGFPNVVAQTQLAAGAAGSVSYGGISVSIPAGAFTDPVTFELLEGPVASFQKNAPSGTTAIADFAFKVMDQKTNALVGKFQKPVLFTLTSSKVAVSSAYYNIATTGAYTVNPIPSTIKSGVSLSHPIAGAGVGWVVTSPAAAVPNATAPKTGVPVLPVVGAGLLLIALGLFFVRRAREAV